MRSLLIIFCLLSISLCFAQYKIIGEIKNIGDEEIILGRYYGQNKFAVDTCYSTNGLFTFVGEDTLKQGMYFLFIGDKQLCDIIITQNQEFSFYAYFESYEKLHVLLESMKFFNSKENTVFYEYQNFLIKKQQEISPLRKMQNEDKLPGQQDQINQEILKIDQEVKKYKSDFEEEHSDMFFTKIIKATTEPIVPQAPSELTKEEQRMFQFKYYKEHYWDNVDFTDERMLGTPIFFSKMDTYLNKLTAQHPDSISKSADVIVKLSRKNKEIFRYVVSYITSTYERSKIMGMDAVFVHMVENYYMTGEVYWIKDKQLKKIEERAGKIAPNLIGRPAPPFLNQVGMPFMKDENDIIRRMYEIESDYTLLIFYSPDCGHCKKVVPKVKEVLDSLRTPRFLSNHKVIDIEAYAVQTEFDKEAWKEFIIEHKTQDWINVCDIQKDPDGNPAASSNWRDQYDIYSTPVIYLLDKEKNILAKRISHNQIAKIISRIESH